MKIKLAILVILVLLIFSYVKFHEPTKEYPGPPPSFPGIASYKTGGWRDTVYDRSMLRFDAERKLNKEEMYKFSAHAIKFARNPNFTVLFYLEPVNSPYARIDYPGGIMTELNGF